MCFESVNSEMTIGEKNFLRKRIHELLGDVSERFVDDVLVVFDTFDNENNIKKLVWKNIVSSNFFSHISLP